MPPKKMAGGRRLEKPKFYHQMAWNKFKVPKVFRPLCIPRTPTFIVDAWKPAIIKAFSKKEEVRDAKEEVKLEKFKKELGTPKATKDLGEAQPKQYRLYDALGETDKERDQAIARAADAMQAGYGGGGKGGILQKLLKPILGKLPSFLQAPALKLIMGDLKGALTEVIKVGLPPVTHAGIPKLMKGNIKGAVKDFISARKNPLFWKSILGLVREKIIYGMLVRKKLGGWLWYDCAIKRFLIAALDPDYRVEIAQISCEKPLYNAFNLTGCVEWGGTLELVQGQMYPSQRHKLTNPELNPWNIPYKPLTKKALYAPFRLKLGKVPRGFKGWRWGNSHCEMVFQFDVHMCYRFQKGATCKGQMVTKDIKSFLTLNTAVGDCDRWFTILDNTLRSALNFMASMAAAEFYGRSGHEKGMNTPKGNCWRPKSEEYEQDAMETMKAYLGEAALAAGKAYLGEGSKEGRGFGGMGGGLATQGSFSMSGGGWGGGFRL
jgi:hypothetical protein